MTPLRRLIFPATAVILLSAAAVFYLGHEEQRISHSRNASPEFGKIIPITTRFERTSLTESVELINQNLAQLKLKDPLKVAILKNGDPLPDGLVRVHSDPPQSASDNSVSPERVAPHAPPGTSSGQATQGSVPGPETLPGASTEPLPPETSPIRLLYFGQAPDVSTAPAIFAGQPFFKALPWFLQIFGGQYSCFYAGNTAYIYDSDTVRTRTVTRTLYLLDRGDGNPLYGVSPASSSIVDITEKVSTLVTDLSADARVEYHGADGSLVIKSDEDNADLIELYFASGGCSSPAAGHSTFERRKMYLERWWYKQENWWQTQNAKIRTALGHPTLPPPPL